MSFRKFGTILSATILLIMLACWSTGTLTPPRSPMQKKTRFLMDTYVAISVPGPAERASSAIDAALDRVAEIDAKFNALNDKSPVYSFNHAGVPIVDEEILSLVRLGLQISRDSQGAFDMTVAPLSELWGFYSKAPRLPTGQEVRDTLKVVGSQHLSFREGKLEKDQAGVRIDLGGIAKGYALSEAVRVLKSRGVRSGLVDAGGDIYALGRTGGRQWRVGVRDPRGDCLLGYVPAENMAVMGSGDYERFFIQDGKRYHHIFDPRTGHPTEGVASVTIIYPDPVAAQAWAKIPFVLGPQKGLEMLEKIPGMEAIIILTTGERLYSRGGKHALRSWGGQ